MGRDNPAYHAPVMVERVVDLLRPLDGGVIVDATFGGGGHTRAILDALPASRVVAIDRDPDAAANVETATGRVSFHLADFRDAERVLAEEGIDEYDGAVLDLGVSSHQLDVGERGFSYRVAGPLDMRMGPDAGTSAAEIVNHWDRDDIATILRRYGEERFAWRIAGAIVRHRPIEDTARLAEVVAAAVPGAARGRGHPARRTFQAIRIAVNDELEALTDGLDVLLRMLRSGGRVVVISYHSLEDRIVKRRFADGARGCVCPPDLPVCRCNRVAELRVITRGAERPGVDEVAGNPRARSARLRAVERI
jgi:16S rRNA (cytosine1402-N4)-methyltransferase